MQVDQLTSYLSQIMHTQESTSSSVVGSNNNKLSSVSETKVSDFDNIFNKCVDTNEESTKTDTRTSLEVAQDAYAQFLSLASGAISGTAASDNESILDNDNSTQDSITKLSEAVNRLSEMLGDTTK